jgi:ATP-dependent HslUV protease, peptidase subunit HslV
MTVAVAVRKHGRTVLAADSLVQFGGQRFPTDNCLFHKIQRLGPSMIVWAGWSLYAELLTAHLAANRPPTLDTEAEVFDFFIKFWRALRDEYTFTRRGAADNHPFVDLESVFLLANHRAVFRVSGDMDVTEFQQYAAVGSGAKYALGALRVLYDTLDDPIEIARRAVQVGIDFDVNCGGPIEITEIAITDPALASRDAE